MWMPGTYNQWLTFPEGELFSDISDLSFQPSNFVVENSGGRCSRPSAPTSKEGKEDSMQGAIGEAIQGSVLGL